MDALSRPGASPYYFAIVLRCPEVSKKVPEGCESGGFQKGPKARKPERSRKGSRKGSRKASRKVSRGVPGVLEGS